MSAVRWINRSKIILLVVFVIACAAAWGYQLVYAVPKARCEGMDRWWYGPERACGVPVQISDVTGRPNPSPAPEQKAAPAPKAP